MKGLGAPRWRKLRRGGLLAALAAATALALIAGNGSVPVALSPLVGCCLLWAMWKLPLRYSLLGMTFFTLAVASPMERAHAGWWEPPWHPVAQLYFNALHMSVPVSWLRFTGMEFLIAYLVAIVAWRRVTGSAIDPPTPPTPRPLARALAISFGAVLLLWAYGIAREGDLTQSVWQARVLVSMPILAGLFAQTLRGPRDAQALGRVVVAAALLKVVVGAYFYFAICRPAGLFPPYVTSHGDSVLFSLAIAVCVANWWERPTGYTFAVLVAVAPAVWLGLTLNDRRLAWVSLGAMLLTIVLVSPWNRAKRALARAAIITLPIWLAYLAVGWNSRSGFFKPVQVLRSITSSDTGSDEDSSTEFRDLENLNLVATIAPHPILGAGFGHPYDEVIKLPDISRAMPFYRYLPHNTVLWLWTVGGWLGYSALWLYLVVGVFFAARAYHRASSPIDRASMLAAISAVVGYLNQAFGDMGVQAYACAITVAAAMALAGQVASRVGAWTERPSPSLTLVPRVAPELAG